MYSILPLQCQRKPVLVLRFITVIFLIYLNSIISRFSSIALQKNMQALNNNSASLLLLVYWWNCVETWFSMSEALFPELLEGEKISCAFPSRWDNTISRNLTLLIDFFFL